MNDSETLDTFLRKKRAGVAHNLSEIMTHLEKGMPEIKRPRNEREEQTTKPSIVLEARCAVATEEGVVLLKKKEGEWMQEKMLLCNRSSRHNASYHSLCFFEIENALYLAAGFSHGIDIVNLSEDECIKIRPRRVRKRDEFHEVKGSFQDISFMGEKDALSSKLVTAHASHGILCVSLQDLVSGRAYVPQCHLPPVRNVQKQDAFSYLQSFVEEVHVALVGNRIICTQGKEAYDFDAKTNTFQSLCSLRTRITSVESDDAENIYLGDEQGGFFRNGALAARFKDQRTIAKIIRGEYQGAQGTYITQRKKGTYGALLFTNCQTIDFVAITSKREQHIRDFTCRGKFCAAIDQREGLFIKESHSSFYSVSLKQKKLRASAIIGGEYT